MLDPRDVLYMYRYTDSSLIIEDKSLPVLGISIYIIMKWFTVLYGGYVEDNFCQQLGIAARAVFDEVLPCREICSETYNHRIDHGEKLRNYRLALFHLKLPLRKHQKRKFMPIGQTSGVDAMENTCIIVSLLKCTSSPIDT